MLRADVAASPPPAITLPSASWEEQATLLRATLASPVHAIVVTAGAWVGGGLDVASTRAMHDACLGPALCGSTLASAPSSLLASGGLLVLTGSAAALQPTPGMAAYGLAKLSTHALVRNFAGAGSVMLPEGAVALGVLPHVIDTPSNREFMPGDRTAWTSPDVIAERVVAWAGGGMDVPASGTLVEAITGAEGTRWVSHPPSSGRWGL